MQNRLKSMTTLNEHDQQLLETLLNQADAVSPGTENGQHTEHRGFNSPEHDFQVLESYINSEMGEDMETMQFDQQTASSGYSGSQQSSTSFPQQATTSGFSGQQQSSGTGYSSQQPASGTGYGSQQPAPGAGYSNQQQASNTGYSTQQPSSATGYGSQQQSTSAGYSSQQQASGSGYGSQSQAASSGFSSQQQVTGTGYGTQPQAAASGYGTQQAASTGYGNQQQASVSNPPAPSDGNFQSQGTAGFGGQQGGYSAVAGVQSPVQMEQVSPGNYQVQSTGYQQIQGRTPSQENFQTHASPGFDQQYSAGSTGLSAQSTPAASVPTTYINQSSGFTQQYPVDSASQAPSSGASSGGGFQNQASPFQSQQMQQPSGVATGQTEQFGQNPESYEQQQQTAFQKGGTQSVSNTEQTFQGTCADATTAHYQADVTGFSQQPAQQQTAAFHQGTSSVHAKQPATLGTGFAQQQQSTAFQTPPTASSQADQSSTAGHYPGQVAKFQNQQPFQSPTGSPCQPDRSVPASPSSYPQPSPDFGTQQVGNGTGYSTGKVPAFQKQQSFHSPAPSPGQSQVDQTVVASPVSYQQPSPAFGAQAHLAYQNTAKTAVLEDQTAGGNYPAQASAFSPASQSSGFSPAPQTPTFSPAPADQPTGGNFHGTSFHQKASDQTDQSVVGSFQAQSATEFTRRFSSQADQSLAGSYQSQTTAFQQQAFQTHSQSAGHTEHQPMDDVSENMSIDAKASAILQETLQAQTSGQQDEGMYDYQTATSQYKAATPSQFQNTSSSQYQATPASQYQAAPASQYHSTPTSPYQAVSSSQFPQAQTSQYQAVPSSQYQQTSTSQYQVPPTTQYQAVPASQCPVTPTTQFQQAQTTQYQQISTSFAQRDQPMDVQSSLVAASSATASSGAFQGYNASSVHTSVFNASASIAASGSSYLNPTLAFQAQSVAFPAVSSLSAQSVSNVAQDQAAIVSSAPAGQFGSASSFGQGQASSSVAFALVQGSGEQHQLQQSPFQQQQHPQQAVVGQTQHSGNAALVRNSSSHTISGLIGEGLQSRSQFHAVISSASQATVNQTAKFGPDQFSHQAGVPTGSHSVQLPIPVVSSGIPVVNSFQAPAHALPQSVTGAVGQVSTPPILVSIGMDKSPAASLIDSSQANAALNLLASLLSNKNLLQGLQGLQALLPPSTQPASVFQLPAPAAAAQPSSVPQESVSGPDVLAKLLQQAQVQRNRQVVVQPQQLVQQQQQFHPAQQQTDPLHQQVKGLQVLQQQQPNFLIQQSPQQSGFVTIQQQQQQPSAHQDQPHHQPAVQIPASVISGLSGNLGNLGALGVAVNSEGQLMIGQHGLKVVLQAGAVTSTASVSSGTQAPPIMAKSTGDSGQPFATTVTPSGLAGLSRGLQSNIKLPAGLNLPSDLQNVSVSPFISTAFSVAASGTHASMAVTCAAPVVESSISSHTTVTPSSSFIHPLPTAGVGLGVGNLSGASSATVGLSDSTDTLTILTSNPELSAVPSSQNLMVGVSSSAGTPSIANIFYPVTTAGTYTKSGEAAQSSAGTPVRNFLNVTTGSASSLLNAFKMAVADGNSGGFSPVPASPSESIFSDTAKPMDTNQAGVKMDALEMEVCEPVIASPSSARLMETDRPVLDLTSRQSSRKSSMDDDEQKAEANSMLRRILTMKDEDPGAPSATAEMLLESPSGEHSPVDLSADHHEMFTDGNTQATLIEKSEKLQLESDVQHEDDLQLQDKMWTFPSGASTPVEEVVPSKVHKGLDDLDASSVHISVPSVEKLFDAGGATSCSSFVFTKFGADVPNSVFTFGNSKSNTAITTATDTRTTSIVTKSDTARPTTLPTASIRPSSRKQKDPGLTYQFPSKVGEYELRILTQPEEQHRARYLTEGSRGAVKDRSQQGYPVIKLLGYTEPATLQIFIGNEAGRVKPHGFYQACKVCGKNSTQCTEREIDGTNVIEIEVSPVNDMQVSMDCVGILKLRNADVEKRIGTSKAKAHKKNSTKARLVFRVTLRKPDGSFFTLQTVSSPILCTQPIGQPEISRMSLSELCVNQACDLFVIGKNFLKGTQILFQELGSDNIEVVWQAEAEIEAEYFQQTHLICRVPSYPKKELEAPVHVQIVAVSGGKTSEPQEFIYKPAMVMVKEEDPMDTDTAATGKALPFGVSPVALQLNRLVERTQHHSTSTSLFQLPPGAVPSIGAATTLSSVPKVVSSNTTQPVSSVLKPAAFALPSAGQPVFPSQKSAPGAVPLQFVLPPLGTGQTVTLDSRQLGSQTPQFLVMNSPASVAASVSSAQQPVLTLNSRPTTSTTPAAPLIPTGSATTLGTAVPISSQPPGLGQAASSSAQMIVILTAPTSTAVPGTVTSSINNNSNMVPLSIQQPASSGQVESLLKQILEASKPS